jgi:glycerophosphoryl diester phosphodiesterase
MTQDGELVVHHDEAAVNDSGAAVLPTFSVIGAGAAAPVS